MDHSEHEHHQATTMMDMGGDDDQCSMNMLFNWDTKNLCVVFKWWHIRTTFDAILTLLIVVLLGMGYEYLKFIGNKYDQKNNAILRTSRLLDYDTNENDDITSFPENGELPTSEPLDNPSSTGPQASSSSLYSFKVQRALIYAVQVFYSFFLMLVFMTYNGQLMIAIAFGAFLGNLLWGNSTPAKRDLTCH